MKSWFAFLLIQSWNLHSSVTQHSITALPGKGVDLIFLCYSFTFSHKSPLHPNPVNTQRKERHYTDWLISRSLCFLPPSACFLPTGTLCCLFWALLYRNSKRLTSSLNKAFTLFAIKKKYCIIDYKAKFYLYLPRFQLQFQLLHALERGSNHLQIDRSCVFTCLSP